MKTMADVFSKKKRSEVMSQIRSKNTGIEIMVFKFLRSHKIYFQKHYDKIKGRPDIAVPSKKIAVFIDGDFWHGWKFNRRKERLPEYWRVKITNNMLRDARRRRSLRKNGWKILRVWEHDLEKNFKSTCTKLCKFLEQK
jgi:DNA mismatch endonuclease (patch repair protein)